MDNVDIPPESLPPASLSEDGAHNNPESSACTVEAEKLGPEHQSKVGEDSVPVLPGSDVLALGKHALLPTEDAEKLEPRDEKVVAGSSEVHDIPSSHPLETSVTQLIDTPTHPELKGSVPTADPQVNDIMSSNASIEVRAPEDDLQNVVQSDSSEPQVEVACVPNKESEPTDPSKQRHVVACVPNKESEPTDPSKQRHVVACVPNKESEPTDPSKQRHVDVNRGLIDTATPFESVKEAVTKFGGIIDWKAHKTQALERRKLVENELENAQEELPKYKKQSEDAKEAEAQVLKNLDSTKRLIEELKLNLERAQTEEHQAKQDSELAKLRVEEMEHGVADDASVAAKAQLEVAKTRHTAALTELKSVKDDLEKLRVDYASLVAEKDVAVKRAEEAESSSREVDKTVEDLTLELITIKASLESAHAAHLEAEERRIGAAMARDQDTLNWEKELKQAEEELQRLNQQLLSEKDLKLSLDTSSSLLLSLKSELLAYMEAKLNQESGEEQSSEDALEESKNKTHMDLQAAVTSAKEELEKMKINIEKATKEANCLKLAAVSLHLELESEKSALATMRQREGMASVAVSSLEADLNKTNAEVSLVQMKEKEFRENMVVLPRKLQKVAQEADQAKSIAQLAREELQKAKEEAEEVKACASTIESRLHAAQMEIEAARESERLALAAAKALHESELTTNTGDEDAPSGVTLSVEEYYSLSKQTQEAEERANIKVAAAISQIEEAKLSQLRSFSELDEVNREIDARKEALRIALEKAEKANEGKLGAEQELRKWRSDHGQKRRASNASEGAVNSPRSQRSSFEEKKEPKSFEKEAIIPVQPVLSKKVDIPVNNTDLDSSTEMKMVVKKKNKLLPRIVKFWGRKNEQAAKH